MLQPRDNLVLRDHKVVHVEEDWLTNDSGLNFNDFGVRGSWGAVSCMGGWHMEKVTWFIFLPWLEDGRLLVLNDTALGQRH